MFGLKAKYDSLFARHIGFMVLLLLANFACALIITLALADFDAATRGAVQMAMVAVISALFCLVLLRMSQSRSETAEAFDALATTDKLTGLTNRDLFQTKLEDRIFDSQGVFPFALLMFDIDRFKELNAFLGYRSADQILVQFAERLLDLAELESDAARISGDEFALLVTFDGSNAELDRKISDTFDQLLASYMCNRQNVDLTFSVGVTLYPDDGDLAEHLMRNAQFALQRAKQAGHDQICCYDDVADPKILEEFFLSKDMERAIREKEFKLHYQPQYSFTTGKQTGYEVLMRWYHKDRGIISPGVFIPIAEKNGLILPLSEFALQEACRTASRWPNPLKIAVNLSPLQMGKDSLIDLVEQTLSETKLDPTRLELEVTESLFIEINEAITNELRYLQKMGISIALDDFGTGYSSLAYLAGFPFDKIKIDRSFVQNLGSDDSTMAIISAVIGMGKGLDMRITAEGIEDQHSYDMLRIAGCSEAQGFLLGKPRDLVKEAGEEMVAPKEQTMQKNKIAS